jgi:hypothetical protein
VLSAQLGFQQSVRLTLLGVSLSIPKFAALRSALGKVFQLLIGQQEVRLSR